MDATHLAMFHQFEGLWIDKGLTFAHLKGLLTFIAKSLYGDGRIRFKPKFYPYTEPSVGVDLACAICDGGRMRGLPRCRMGHDFGRWHGPPQGLSPSTMIEEVTGIAFGLGTTRMAAQWAGVSKVKSLYDQELAVLHDLHRPPHGGAA